MIFIVRGALFSKILMVSIFVSSLLTYLLLSEVYLIVEQTYYCLYICSG
jgi:hypothetical protein